MVIARRRLKRLKLPGSVDNNMDELYDNEILIDVQTLNVDSASFTQIEEQAGGDKAKIAEIMLGIVAKQGARSDRPPTAAPCRRAPAPAA